MSHKRLWVAAGIIAVIIFGGFVLSVPHTSEIKVAAPAVSTPSAPTVTLHDAYKKGVHTITGSVTAPNVCAQVSAAASLSGATSSQSIIVAISLSDDSGVCLQLPAKLPFSMTLSAPARLPIEVTVNGAEASTSAP